MAGRRVSVYLSDVQQCILEVHGLQLRDVVRRVIELCEAEVLADPEQAGAYREALLQRHAAVIDASLDERRRDTGMGPTA